MNVPFQQGLNLCELNLGECSFLSRIDFFFISFKVPFKIISLISRQANR